MKTDEAKRVGWKANCAMFALGLLAIPVASGCGQSGPDRQRVVGTVSYQGSPLRDGAISFFPTATGAPGGAAIVDGAFDIPAGKGLAPGEYRVEIEAWQETGGQAQGDPADPSSMVAARRQVIPQRFNSKSELKATVSGSGDNTFDFNLDD